ncbi:MAG: hypothetical protein PHI31_00735 [Desulfuromonadaceae bacterium]|nr:hypothetical protein [Desulfuromonadaceae bacterium]
MKTSRIVICLLTALTVAASSAGHAEETAPAPVTPPGITAAPPEAVASSSSSIGRFFTEAEWYFSWGYSSQSYAPTDIHVSQPSLGSKFTVHNVSGHDEPGWDGGIFNKGLFVPQYNIRVGRFIDDERTLAIELNLDHTKYTSTIGQTSRVTGTINGASAPASMLLTTQDFRYDLHNGANHVMVNLVKRIPLIGKTNESLSLAGIAKVGGGLVIPHSSNSVLGKSNDAEIGPKKFSNFFGFHHGWWQFDGVTAGIEAGLRFVVAKPVYIELTDKVAYARMYDIPVYQGTATHNLWMNEVIFSLGVTYDGPKKAVKN